MMKAMFEYIIPRPSFRINLCHRRENPVKSVNEWFEAGARVEVKMNQWPQPYSVFCRAVGRGGWLTLLHGFPTCSLDWESIQEPLAARHRLLLFDFLGFGDSDKPADHTYSIHEQADLTEALWRHFGVESTALVVHDYGVSVGQELLARHAEGKLAVALERIAFLNGGLYPDLHRALLVQKLLLNPRTGPLLSKRIDERALARGLRRVFAPAHRPSDAEL